MLRFITHHLMSRAAAAVALLLIVPSAFGQLAVQVQATSDGESPDTDKAPGFSVHKEERPVADAFEDFERYRDKKAWEKAFGALGKIEEGKPGHLVGDKDGFFVPTDLKVRAELLTLPPEGREAYRLFNDAKAAQLLKAVAVSGPGEIPALNRLVNRYFITAIGDQAADQLGDALFESGDFSNAQHCWQIIVENYPDSSLSQALLQTKRAMAMARYGQWDQFELLRASVHDRYAGQKIHIGGQDVVATEFVEGLKQSNSAAPSPSPGGSVEQFTTGFVTKLPADTGSIFPASDQPVWQMPLMDAQASSQLIAQLGQTGWGAMAGQFTQAVPATAVDENRIYVNWLGICFTADMKTGKLLWRTDSFGDMTTKMSQAMMQGTSIDPMVYSTTLCNDRVIFTRRSTDTQNYNELPMTRLHCLSADAGKMLWKTDSGLLSGWGFIGQPMVSGEVFYIAAHPGGSQEMSILCIGLAKGDLRWQVSLGTPAPSTNYRGVPTVPAPTLQLRSGKMLVLTNNGALLQIDMGTHQVEWALTYPAYVDTQQQNYGYVPGSAIAPGTLLAVGPTIYFKEYNSNLMFAMDPSMPAIKWKRRIDPNVGLASFDGKNMFLLADEMECMDIDSRMLLWDSKMNTHTGALRPLVQGNMMYLLGSKGIDAIRLGTGESTTRFKGYDHECDGGVLWKTSNRLVTVSSRAITAYPLSSVPNGK